jgi:hypothetical protein
MANPDTCLLLTKDSALQYSSGVKRVMRERLAEMSGARDMKISYKL